MAQVGGDWTTDFRTSTYDKLPKDGMNSWILDLFNAAAATKGEKPKKAKKVKEVSETLDRDDYDDEEWADILRREKRMRQKVDNEVEIEEEKVKDVLKKKTPGV